MHDKAFQWVQCVAWSCPRPLASVLELGSLEVNGSVKEIFTAAKPDVGGIYIGVDLQSGPGVHIVGDAATVDLGRQFDAVVCCEVLEHATNPVGIVRNGLRHLGPQGVFIMTAAGPEREPHSVDGGPLKPGEHYQAITRAIVTSGLHGFAGRVLIDEFSVSGDIRAVVWR